MPSSSQELPSPVLSTRGGGSIALEADSAQELRALERYFRLELTASGLNDAKLEERLYVLFHHPAEPLVKRWYRSLRRVFLRQFDV